MFQDSDSLGKEAIVTGSSVAMHWFKVDRELPETECGGRPKQPTLSPAMVPHSHPSSGVGRDMGKRTKEKELLS